MSRKRILIALVFALAGSHAHAGELEDPTRPAIATGEAAGKVGDKTPEALILHAILFAEGRRIAIVNDQRLHEDDIIQAARVVAIERDRVLLTRGGRKIELELVHHDVKSAPLPAAPAEPSAQLSTLEGIE